MKKIVGLSHKDLFWELNPEIHRSGQDHSTKPTGVSEFLSTILIYNHS